jgi:hypothetical protein
MKLELVSINARFTHTTLAHYYQLRLIEQFNSGYNYTALLYEYTINAKYTTLLLELSSHNWDVLLFSVYIWNREIVQNLVQDLIKLHPDRIIVIGGPEVTYRFDSWPNFPGLIKVLGGEESLIALLKSGFNPATFKEDHESALPLDEVPFPYTDSDLSRLKKRYVYYETSRGCIRNCSYCLSSNSAQRIQFRSLEKVLEEIEIFIRNDVEIVKLVDRTFNSKPERARNIWKFILDNNRHTTFHFEIDASLLSEEDFILLSQIPKEWFDFEIGIQSTNTKTLAEINRGSDIISVLNNVKSLKNQTSIHLHVDLIAGLPFESLIGLEKSFNDVIELKAHHFQLGFLKILPGTEIEKKHNTYGIVYQDKPPYTVLKTSWLTSKDFIKLNQIEELLDSLYNKNLFPLTLNYLYDNTGGAFQFYVQFAEFLEAAGDSPGKPEQIVRLLFDFFRTMNLETNTLSDLLVFEYLSSGTSLTIPEYLGYSPNREQLERCLSEIKDERLSIETGKLSKRTVLFIPKSDEFYEILSMNKRRLFLFINGVGNNMNISHYSLIFRKTK